jgi:anti-sigma factor RsiW
MNTKPTCEKVLLVQADFDGELDPAQAAALETHRAGCAVCQAAYADLQRVRGMLRGGDLYHAAPDDLRRRITNDVARAAQPLARKHAGWGRMFASGGVGAALAAAIVLMVIAPGQNQLIDDVVAGHVRALQPGHLVDVVSTDRHTVKPWFDGKLDFAPPVKDLAAEGFPLEGGRLDYLDNRPVAALVYGRAKHQINFFIWPAAGHPNVPNATSARHGYNVVHFVQNGMTIWMASDLEKDELVRFAQLWQAAP